MSETDDKKCASGLCKIFGCPPNTEIPMGVSQWAAHGRKYGYWDYFLKQVLCDPKRMILALIALNKKAVRDALVEDDVEDEKKNEI